MWAIGKMLDAASEEADADRGNNPEPEKAGPVTARIRIAPVLHERPGEIEQDSNSSGDEGTVFTEKAMVHSACNAAYATVAQQRGYMI